MECDIKPDGCGGVQRKSRGPGLMANNGDAAFRGRSSGSSTRSWGKTLKYSDGCLPIRLRNCL